ncbi:hypothetical protein Ocin01_12886, partial [Orchesella cincta]
LITLNISVFAPQLEHYHHHSTFRIFFKNMLFFLKNFSIYFLLQVVVAGSSASQDVSEGHNIQKRYSYPTTPNYYQGSTYPQYNQNATCPPPKPYPLDGCNCLNCTFDTRPCTKDVHPTGCTVQYCTADDTFLLGYTCWCGGPYFPGGCMDENEAGKIRCTTDTSNTCYCNGISKCRTFSYIDVCMAGEQPTCSTTCLCHPTEPTRRPCGCVTGTIRSSLDTNTLAEQIQAILDEQEFEQNLNLMESSFTSSFPNDPGSHKIQKRYSYPVAPNYPPGASYPVAPNYYPGTSYPSNYQATTCPPTNSTPPVGCDCQNCNFNTKPCTKDDHPTGCTLQDCTAADTVLHGYMCYCTASLTPGGCVRPNVAGKTRCPNYFAPDCYCNSIGKSGTNCYADVCAVGEKPTCSTRCLCHPTDPTLKPCGCVTGVIASGGTLAAEVEAILAEQEREQILNFIESSSANSFPFSAESNHYEFVNQVSKDVSEGHNIQKRYSYPTTPNYYQGSTYPPYNHNATCPPPNPNPLEGCDCLNCTFDTRPCTKDVHPTGCTVQYCTADDTFLLGYTCWCTIGSFPGGCMDENEAGKTRCTTDTSTTCYCNGISKCRTFSYIDVCMAGEQPTCSTTCLCHPADPTRRPCGCVTGTIRSSLDANTLAEQIQAILDEQGFEQNLNSMQSSFTSSFPASTGSHNKKAGLLNLLLNL